MSHSPMCWAATSRKDDVQQVAVGTAAPVVPESVFKPFVRSDLLLQDHYCHKASPVQVARHTAGDRVLF